MVPGWSSPLADMNSSKNLLPPFSDPEAVLELLDDVSPQHEPELVICLLRTRGTGDCPEVGELKGSLYAGPFKKPDKLIASPHYEPRIT